MARRVENFGNVQQRRCDYDRAVSDDRALAVETDIPVSLQPAVSRKLELAVTERVAERLRGTAASADPPADPTLWGPPGTPEIANRLGWLTIAERMLGKVEP